MNISFDSYSYRDIGKFFKDSKRGHLWQFTIDKKTIKIEIKESFSSKQFWVFYCDKLITAFKTTEEDKQRGLDFQVENLFIHVKRILG